jgi:hypothetical protein
MPPTRKSGIVWKRDPADIGKDFEAWVQVNITSRAERRAEALADEIVDWMRQNAEWEDQTGEARERLDVQVIRSGRTIQFIIRHGAEHGIFLELMQSGRFAIIGPAVAFWGPKMLERMVKQ